MPHLLRSRIGRKLLIAVGLPTLLVALAGIAWLRAETRAFAPGLWGAVLAFLIAFAVATALLHLLAVRLLIEQPLARVVRSLRRAEAGDFMLRVPIASDDELGELARSFNTALAAITDLRWRRLEDAQSMESMERELSLKEQVEAQARQLDLANRGLETRLRELTLLAELARTMSSTLRLDQLLHAITARVGSALGHEVFALLLVDERSGELIVSDSAGLATQMNGTRLQLGQGVAGVAARDKQLVLVRDTRLDPRFPVQLWTGGEHGSLLAVPMVAQDACVGVLDFFRPAADAFPEDQIRFLESVAGQAALAIANARLHERTVALSLTDPLTGVHNRRGFFLRLELELEHARRFGHGCAVAMVDVDRLQALNETLGRLAGDATLRAVAELLSGALRKVDTLARVGGEEFAVLLPHASRGAGLEVAEKLRALVAAEPLEHGRVTVSVGLAAFPEDASDLATLLDCADAALFAAKKAGRDTVVAFAPGMRDLIGRRRDIQMTGVP